MDSGSKDLLDSAQSGARGGHTGGAVALVFDDELEVIFKFFDGDAAVVELDVRCYFVGEDFLDDGDFFGVAKGGPVGVLSFLGR